MDYHSDRAVHHVGRRPTCQFAPTRGETVARAKRTDRAEARRRYRAAMVEQGQGEPEAAEVDQDRAAARAGRSAYPGAGAAARTPERPGIFSAFRLAMRPVHYIDDLRYAPTLILRTNAIWPPVLISVVALAYGLTRTDYNDPSIQFVTSFALPMTPLIQPMLAGFLAPRATWLAGLITSVISGICFEILILWYYSGHLANLPASQANLTSDEYVSFTIQVLATAVALGSLLGAASGWYKRFLTLAGAGSTRNQKRPAAKKPAPRQASRGSTALR
jgi:hypothetical protein